MLYETCYKIYIDRTIVQDDLFSTTQVMPLALLSLCRMVVYASNVFLRICSPQTYPVDEFREGMLLVFREVSCIYLLTLVGITGLEPVRPKAPHFK